MQDWSNEDFRNFTFSFRNPIKPTPIRVSTDLNEFENSILLAYLFEKSANVELINLPALEKTLQNLHSESPEKPELPCRLTYEDNLHEIAEVLSQYYSDRFFRARLDIPDFPGIITAKKKPMKITLPNGEEIPYTLITEESSANYPLTYSAFSTDTEIFLRENAQLYVSILAQNQEVPPEIIKQLPLVPIAHEICERRNEKNGSNPKSLTDRELLSETDSRKFLVIDNGVSEEVYSTYHSLLANRNRERPNLSQMIQNLNFDP